MNVGNLSAQLDKSRRQMRTLAVVTDYANDEPLAVISERYDLAPATISNYARAFGLPARRGPLPTDKEKQIVKLYRGGTEIKRIIEATGCDRKTIWRVAKDHNLPLRNPGGKAIMTDAQVRMIRAFSGNVSELARTMKVRRETLQRIRSGESYKDVK